MHALAERWLESFSKWPAVNQMAFSAVLLLAGLVLTTLAVYVLYLGLYYAAVACRGWPDDTDRPRWADVMYLQRQMEAYRQWEKQQQTTRSRNSTKPSSPGSPAAAAPPSTPSVVSPGR